MHVHIIYDFNSQPTHHPDPVCANIEHSRYILPFKTSNFRLIYFHTKRLYGYMFDVVDTPFSYGRALSVNFFMNFPR